MALLNPSTSSSLINLNTDMIFYWLLIPSLIAALLAFVVRPYRPWVGWANALLSLISLGAALGLAGQAIAQGNLFTAQDLEAVFRSDSLSALILVCVAAVATLTLFLSPGLGPQAQYDAAQLRRYHVCLNLFIASMLLAVSANNVGVMWIAIEATTIFSALILPLTLTKASVEASWKYLLLSSVGIALAFAGTVLSYFDFVTLAGGHTAASALNWPVLLTTAPRLHPEVMRLAFVFLLVGYGTKAGLAPMHTWKPDAYGEAPAPLGALMSSALFAVAMYAILRWKVVTDATLGAAFSDSLLIALGLLSLAIAAFSVVLSRYYKRMLAYSSLEHSGLICLGLGLGPLGVLAALLHLVNHTAAKSLAFFLSGHIERKYGSTQIEAVRGLLKTMPGTGALYAVAMLVLMGLPPGGLFIAELALFRAGFAQKQPWLMLGVLALLVVMFIALANHLSKMLFGAPPEGLAAGEGSRWHLAPLLFNVAVLATLGLFLPAPFLTLLNNIVSLVSR
jgi:hydrogenase-4 component F